MANFFKNIQFLSNEVCLMIVNIIIKQFIYLYQQKGKFINASLCPFLFSRTFSKFIQNKKSFIKLYDLVAYFQEGPNFYFILFFLKKRGLASNFVSTVKLLDI